jgi:hypothetical protein
VQQVAAFVGNGNRHGPVVQHGFGFSGRSDFFDVGQFKARAGFHGDRSLG